MLAFSIGLYLPIYLSTPIMVGGLIRWFIDNKRKYDSDAARKDGSDRGVLYAAGMIAGEGIVGILLAVLAVDVYKRQVQHSGVSQKRNGTLMNK